MARDNAYRWITPLNASDYYVGRELNLDFFDAAAWLRPHVESGAIRAMLDGIEITPLIARIVLAHFDSTKPKRDKKLQLPANLLLLRPDVERVLSRRTFGLAQRPGRPAKAGSLADKDLRLTQEMNRLRRTGGFDSPTAAARHLVENGDVAGGGTSDSKVRRLVQRYKHRFGDDG